jgi:uncharacterized protein (DUF1499 family)
MKILGFMALLVLTLAVALLVAGQLGFLAGTPPQKLGVTGGRLAPPSKNPNSVSSQTALHVDHPQKEYAAIAPLKFTGDGDAAMDRLADLLQKSERTVLVKREPGYIYAQNTTLWFKFTDDMEFLLDKPGGVIHVRSSSRLGRKDFGANRTRMEAIRVRFSNQSVVAS